MKDQYVVDLEVALDRECSRVKRLEERNVELSDTLTSINSAYNAREVARLVRFPEW